jgi:hypothetical protein
MKNDLEITKYPYLGYSPNLIEYFLIIGYEKSFIYNDILPNFSNDPRATYEPTTLNTISVASDVDMLDNDMIVKLIFPKFPTIWSTNNLIFDPPTSSTIFFLNADTFGESSKIPFHGCALLFNEYFIINSNKIFVPKAFCIISQYPYFSLFNAINKEILNMFRTKTEIPIEILIYNMLNFIPSPINFSLNLQTFPVKELFHYANHYPHHHNSFNSKSSSKDTPLTNYANSASRSSIMGHSTNVLQLNGYPVLDFNISEIFNILPMHMVVEILIFNFLEFDMLFFSKNLEILNFTMYIISVLNYPCSDSIYLWHILSVAPEELLLDTSQFVGKPCTSMVGINCTYNSAVDSCKIVNPHFIVDIDNRQFLFKYNENSDEVTKANTLLLHIRRIVRDYNVNSFFLSKNIKNLLKELDIISKQVLTNTSVSSYYFSSRETTNNSNSIHEHMPNNVVQTNFFETGDKVKILNKNIQEAFYDFILNILIVFYNNYFLNSSFDKKKAEEEGSNSNFFIHYNEDTSKFSKEEAIFYNFFKSSSKYNNYILNFIQVYKCINLYKIPLIFSEEFIYLKKNSDEKLFKSRFFEIIENFYMEGNNKDKDGKENSQIKKSINVNFHNFYCYYENNLKNYFYEEVISNSSHMSPLKVSKIFYELKEDKNSQIKDKEKSQPFQSCSSNNSINLNLSNDKSDKFKYQYEYDIIEFDNSILFKYLHHMNNLPVDLKEEIFPSISYKKINEIKQVKFGEIVDAIEKNLINHKIIKSDQMIIFSLILVFIMTRPTCNFNESISHLRDMLELLHSKSFFLRKYMNLILSIYNLPQTSDQLNQNSKKSAYINKMCNFIIINFLRHKNILPNEVMMNLFENFTLQSEKEKEEDFNTDSLLEEDSSNREHDLEKFNLFLQYHFCTHGLRKSDYFLKLAENTLYDGDLYLDCCQSNEGSKKTCLGFKFDFCNKLFTSEIFSPLKLYNSAYKLYACFIQNYQFELLDRDLLDKVIINLIFYCKHLNMTYKFLLKFMDYEKSE